MKQDEMSRNKTSITKDEAEKLVRLIDKCQPGNLPSNVFESVAKVAVYPALEFVLLRYSRSEIETLLFRRAASDPVWPSLFHVPGTVLRPTDEDIQSAISRLIHEELSIPGLRFSKPVFTGVHINKYIRGTGLGIEYWVEVMDVDDVDGTFFNVNNLPMDFIQEQRGILDRAVSSYKAAKQALI